ncbi:hypothetical protein [Streptomyces iakyrus]
MNNNISSHHWTNACSEEPAHIPDATATAGVAPHLLTGEGRPPAGKRARRSPSDRQTAPSAVDP